MADNWEAVLIFMDCAGQWLLHPAYPHTPIAINRQALQVCIDLWPVEADKRSDTFHRIRVLEGAAAAEFKRRSKSG